MIEQSHFEQTVYLLLLGLILSILVNLYFANNRLRSKLQDKRIDKLRPQIIQQFLKDQADKTANARRHSQRNHLSKAVIAIRNAYLMIEHKAIERKIDSEEYWHLINSKVGKLLEIINEHQAAQPINALLDKIQGLRDKVVESGNTETTQSVLQSLDKFQTACLESSNDPIKLKKMGEKLDAIHKKLSSAAYRKVTEKTKMGAEFATANQEAISSMKASISRSEQAMKHLASINPDDFDFSFDKFNSNQQSLQQGLEAVENNVQAITKKSKAIEATIIKSSEQQVKNTNRDLDELYEQIQEENEREIERLRTVIKNQKNIIFELEDGIARLEEAQEGQGSANNIEQNKSIKQLKNCLRDAELCINTLEREVENLREQHKICEINLSEEPVTAPLDNNHLASLEHTIEQLKQEVQQAKVMHSMHDQSMKFLTDCLGANSVEDISLSIYQSLNDMGWDSALIIKADTRNMEINPDGLLTPREKALIQNMQPDEIDSKRHGEELRFHYNYLYGKLVSNSNDGLLDERQKHVLELLKITDKLLGKIKSNQVLRQQQKRLQDSANSVKRLALDVEKTLETMNKRSRDSVSASFGQIQDIARSKGLKASQIASFRNLEQQTLDELAADQTLRLKVKKQFLLILKNLEDD